jgi:FkbM family methyltransferase
MDKNIKQILSIIDNYRDKPDFLDILFGEDKEDALTNRPVIICCAGDLGKQMLSTLQSYGIFPAAMCENDSEKINRLYLNTPITSFEKAIESHPGALFVLAIHKHRDAIYQQLITNGIPPNSIKCANSDSDLIYQYIGIGTQGQISIYKEHRSTKNSIAYLSERQNRIAHASEILYDEKSRQLLTTKLALLASHGQFTLFSDYIHEFSEPYRDFGLLGYEGTPEDYYYFNNDIFNINDNELYIDVGAFDGDTIDTFIDACTKNGKQYQEIIAFEPDPGCFEKLHKKYSSHKNISLQQIGLWSSTTQVRFLSTQGGAYEQGAAISESGDITIHTTSLDDFLKGSRVSLIKMDPPGNILPEVIKGAVSTIQKHRPNLAIGAYHGPDSIFELPLLVNAICPEYRIALRQNTCHLCDTDLLATINNLRLKHE